MSKIESESAIICLAVYLSIYLSIYLSFGLPIYLSNILSIIRVLQLSPKMSIKFWLEPSYPCLTKRRLNYESYCLSKIWIHLFPARFLIPIVIQRTVH